MDLFSLFYDTVSACLENQQAVIWLAGFTQKKIVFTRLWKF